MLDVGYISLIPAIGAPAATTATTLAFTNSFWPVLLAGGLGSIIGVSIAATVLHHHYLKIIKGA